MRPTRRSSGVGRSDPSGAARSLGTDAGWIAWALAAVLLTVACSTPDGPSPRAEVFPGSAESLQALGAEALGALSEGDAGGLEALRLKKHEHNDVVWPELPASDPGVNFPLDYAWRNIELRNQRALGRIQPWFQGRDMEFGEVRCRGEVQEFETFKVHTDCWVVFETSEHGLLEVQLFKDVLERNGGFKIFRYYEEGPGRVADSGRK